MSVSEQAEGSRGTTSRTCIWGLVTVPVLVHAQHVHPGQGLDGVHLVDQRPVPGQPHHAHRQGHGGQQEQPLRDHADEGRHHGDHRLPQPQILVTN